jgi:general secretion pathway protein L
LSILYIRPPSRAAADHAPHWITLPCPFALVSQGSTIEQEGIAVLPDLAETITKAQRVVLLVAGSDINLLRIKAPPLSASRFKAALPHLVEDQLLTDPSECVIVADQRPGEMRTVAVMQRAWLDILSRTLLSLGARTLMALPAQLCLPHQPGSISVAAVGQGYDTDLVLRLSAEEGIGLLIMPQEPDTAIADVLQTISAIVPTAALILYVPSSRLPHYHAAIDADLALSARITLFADHWPHWIAGAQGTSLNLMTGLGGNTGAGMNWHRWRWSLGLVATVLAINALGLNIDWWRMKQEADTLRITMIQTYQSAYPKETVIVDPVAQMQQKITASQRQAGQSAPDDFIALTAHFGEAWKNIVQHMPGRKTAPAIAALEYRERSLMVRLKPESEITSEQMKSALAGQHLSVSQPSAGMWQIRSAP